MSDKNSERSKSQSSISSEEADYKPMRKESLMSEKRKIIDLSQEHHDKTDFYELDSTFDLVQNHHKNCQLGRTLAKHNIKYSKNEQMIRVEFPNENLLAVGSSSKADDATVIRFARKSVLVQNFSKL